MELFNIGIPELLLILLIAIVVLGPQDLVKYSRKAGLWIYKLVRSDFWRQFVGTAQEIREMPKKVIREAGLEEDLRQIRESARGLDAELRGELKAQEVHLKENHENKAEEPAKTNTDAAE